MRSPVTERTVPGILTDLLTQFTQLLRTEGELARTELSGKVNQVGTGLALVVGGAVLLIPALVVLLGAAVAALERAGYPPHWSALIVGGAALIVARQQRSQVRAGVRALARRDRVPTSRTAWRATIFLTLRGP